MLGLIWVLLGLLAVGVVAGLDGDGWLCGIDFGYLPGFLVLEWVWYRC